MTVQQKLQVLRWTSHMINIISGIIAYHLLSYWGWLAILFWIVFGVGNVVALIMVCKKITG